MTPALEKDAARIGHAIVREVAEHGAPNTWQPSELTIATGLSPMRIGAVLSDPNGLATVARVVGVRVTYAPGRITVGEPETALSHVPAVAAEEARTHELRTVDAIDASVARARWVSEALDLRADAFASWDQSRRAWVRAILALFAALALGCETGPRFIYIDAQTPDAGAPVGDAGPEPLDLEEPPGFRCAIAPAFDRACDAGAP